MPWGALPYKRMHLYGNLPYSLIPSQTRTITSSQPKTEVRTRNCPLVKTGLGTTPQTCFNHVQIFLFSFFPFSFQKKLFIYLFLWLDMLFSLRKIKLGLWIIIATYFWIIIWGWCGGDIKHVVRTSGTCLKYAKKKL